MQASALTSRFGFRLLKAMLWMLCAAPLADLLLRAGWGSLGANPQETLLRATGTWTLTLLLVTLAVTPLRRLLKWPELVGTRRLLGLWAFAYATIHLLGFWAFEHDFHWVAVLKDGLKRPFVTVGLVSFALLVPMAMTSNHAAVRRLGSQWKKIHRLIYAVALLACLHFFLHRAGKSNFLDPVIALSITLALLLMRVRWRRNARTQ